jgi:hypothetical protein
MTQITQQDVAGGFNHVVADKRLDLDYDIVGNFDVIRRYASLDTTSPVALSDFTFDMADRVTEIEHRTGATPGSGTLLAGYALDWDEANRLTEMEFIPDGTSSPFDYSAETATFGYDPRNQLTAAAATDRLAAFGPV